MSRTALVVALASMVFLLSPTASAVYVEEGIPPELIPCREYQGSHECWVAGAWVCIGEQCATCMGQSWCPWLRQG